MPKKKIKKISYITISGPAAAGKDVISYQIYKFLQKKFGDKVYFANYFKTREPRSTEKKSKYFITKKVFLKRLKSGKILIPFVVNDYFVGYGPQELIKSEVVILNIAADGSRQLKQIAKIYKRKCFSIFVHAPKNIRVKRFLARDPSKNIKDAILRMNSDSTSGDPSMYKDFDLILENKEGQLKNTVKKVITKVNAFLNA